MGPKDRGDGYGDEGRLSGVAGMFRVKASSGSRVATRRRPLWSARGRMWHVTNGVGWSGH